MQIDAVVFDLGNTLIDQYVDSGTTLDRVPLRLLPGVREALEVLYGRYRLALLTNTQSSNSEHVRRALEQLSIGRFFEVVVTSIDVGVEKPAAGIFCALLAELRLHPNRAVMIGNDRKQDIEGARRVGLRTGYFVVSPKEATAEVNCDFTFSSFDELPSRLRALEALDGRCY